MSPESRSPRSVTAWITDLKAGKEAAAQRLWERYCVRLGDLASRHLGGLPRRAVDEEDVAQLAFANLCAGVQDGRFSKLTDRDDLWQLLVVITERKAIDVIRHEHRQKRGGGKVRGESAFVLPNDEPDARGIEHVIDDEPTPEYAALAAEECQRLLELLDNEGLRQVALWKMQGYSNREISRKLDCVERSVERKLKGIRAVWLAESAS